MVGPEFDLRQHLVGERRAHHETRMAGGAAEIDQPPLRQDDDPLAVGEHHPVDLRLDLVPLHVAQRGDLDFRIEVADVADDGAVLHGAHVLQRDHVDVAGGGHEHVAGGRRLVHRRHLEALHRRLEGADRVDLGDDHPRAGAAQRLRRSLAYVAVTGHHRDLAGEHDVGRAADAVHQAFSAAVEVVELRLGDRVVDVDRRRRQRPRPLHFVQAVDPRRRLLRQAAHPGHQLRVLLVHDFGQVAAVVEDHVGSPAAGAAHGAVDAAPELLVGLPLPGEDGEARRRHRRRRVVLGREHVAAGPAQFGAERPQRLHEHRGLDGHVQAAGDSRAGERARGAVFLAQRHQPGHFRLGEGDLLAPPIGERHVGDLAVGGFGHPESPGTSRPAGRRGGYKHILMEAVNPRPAPRRRFSLRTEPGPDPLSGGRSGPPKPELPAPLTPRRSGRRPAPPGRRGPPPRRGRRRRARACCRGRPPASSGP